MIFKRKTPNRVTDLMVDYINSMLPNGIMCRETIGDNTENSLMIFSNTNAVRYAFDLSEGYDVKELSDADKMHLIRTVILPALKTIDKELFSIHKKIEEKVKELEKL